MNIQGLLVVLTTVGVLFTASCSPSIRPQPAPQPKPDTSAYSTKAAGDATIVAAATPSPYYLEIVAIDGNLLATKSTRPVCYDFFSCIEIEEFGVDGRKSAFLSPGYHCVTTSFRNFKTEEDRNMWTGYTTFTTSCFDVIAGRTYSFNKKEPGKLISTIFETDLYPKVTDTRTGKVVLPVSPSNPEGSATATVSFSGNAGLAGIDGRSIYDKDKPVKRSTVGKFLSPSATMVQITPGYHTITLSRAMVAYDFPAGRDIRLAFRKEGIFVLDAATGAILKSPGGKP